jgi:acyl dehydratase
VAALAFRLFWQSGFIYGGSLGSPGVDELRWLLPVRPGDTIFVEAEVVSLRLSSKGDRGYIGVSYAVKNQKGETVLTMTGTQIMALRPSRDPRPRTKPVKAK